MVRSTHAVLYLLRTVIGEHTLGVRLPARGVFLKKIPVDNVGVIIQQNMGNRVEKTNIPI